MTCLNINILSQHSLYELRNAKWEEEVFCKIRVLLRYSHVRIKKSMETPITKPVSSRDPSSENLLSRTGADLEIIRSYL